MDDINDKSLKIEALVKWNDKKIELSNRWIDNEENQRNRKIHQREIYLCNLGENLGSEINKLRPVLVVSKNKLNSNNVIVVTLSTKLKYLVNNKKLIPRYRTHYFLFIEKYNFLHKDSVVKCEQIRSISKVRLTNKLGIIDEKDFNNIMIRLKELFG